MALIARIAAVSALVAAIATAGPAAAFNDPDWPCVQRKVTRMSWGQMWTGPALPEAPEWREDPELARLVPWLAARRTPLEDAEAEVAAMGARGEATRDQRLVRLFAGVFSVIDDERARIIEGIERYARKQRALSEHIDARRLEIAALEGSTAEDDYDGLDRIEALQDELTWDTRIYDERRKSLTYVCETPVILEKRAFAVARLVQGALGQ